MNNIVCYISHYSKLSERKKDLEVNLDAASLNMPIVWLDQFDRELLSQDLLDKYISSTFDANIVYKANAIAHINALESAASETHNALILEDDIILSEHFIKVLSSLNFPPNWDMIFLSEGCDLHAPAANDVYTFHRMNQSRCASCYLVSNKAAKFLAPKLVSIERAIDHEYNKYCSDLNVYWLEPTIACEGTKIGIYKSSVMI